MKAPLIEINDFKGGMTLSEKMGRTDQFHTGYQLDFSSKSGKIAPGYAWRTQVFDGNSYVPDEFQVILATEKDGELYFGADDTKIYRQLDSGTIEVAVDSNQAGAVRSLAEYEEYMYYSQDTTVGRSDLVTPTYTHNWQTGLNTATFHPIWVSSNAQMYIGHGNDVASWDNTTFTATALDLPIGWEIRTLCDFGNLYLAIGANYGAQYTATKSKIFLWNRSDETWNDEIIIPEKEIKAMVFEGGYLWIWAGRSCNLYVVSESSRYPTKVWSFTKEDPGDKFEVYPNAVTTRNGTIYFGLSGVGTTSVSKNPVAIYSFPADPENFSLNIVLKQNYDDRIKSLGLFRVETEGDIIYASIYDASVANKELLKCEDLYTAPYSDNGIYESFRYYAPKNKRIFTEAFGIQCDPLPADCDIGLAYKKDNDSTWTDVWTTSDFQTDDATEKIVKLGIIANSLKLKMTLGGAISSSVLRPFVSSIYVTGALIAK